MRAAYVPINRAAASARARLQGVLDQVAGPARGAGDAVSRAGKPAPQLEAMQKAVDAGIPTVNAGGGFYDAQGTVTNAYISQFDLGEKAARQLAKDMGGKGKIFAMLPIAGHSATVDQLAALKAVLKVACRNLPDTHTTIVRARDECVAVSGDSAYTVMVPTKRADEVWVVTVVSWWPGLHNAPVTGLWQLPDTECRITGPSNDQRLLGHHDWCAVRGGADLDRLENFQTANRRRVSLEDLKALARLDVPYSHAAIGGSGYQRVSFILQSPHTTLVAFKSPPQGSSLGVVDIDFGVITAGQDLVAVEQKAGHHMAMVSPEGKVLWLTVFHHPSFADEVVTLIQRLEQVHASERIHSNSGVRDSLRSCIR